MKTVKRSFSQEAFREYVQGLDRAGNLFEAKGIVLHNTAIPNLRRWITGPPAEQWLVNLEKYYQFKKKWSGCPHLFVDHERIHVLNSLSVSGVHSPSFNRTHFGVEMVGDYAREEFDSGDGALVRDNTISALATLCEFGGLTESKIVLHKEDPRTSHDCPGKNVRKQDILYRVGTELKARKQPLQDKSPWETLIAKYATTRITYPELKPVTLAHWMLQSDRGQTPLAVEHKNFAGLRWREEMATVATPVLYRGYEGDIEYCKFPSLDAFITGYWEFVRRPRYLGWEAFGTSPEDFIRLIVAHGFSSDIFYADRVLALLDEATTLLRGVGSYD